MRLLASMLVGLALSSAGTIPDSAALLKDVAAHQTRIDEMRENYTWTRIRQTDERDGHGKVQSTLSEKLECFYVNGRLLSRLVAKNGVVLNAGEQGREQDRLRRRIEAVLKQPARKRGSGQLNLISEILPVANVSNPKRVDFRGRPTLTFDFVGDRNAAAHSMEQKAARDISGAIWIDEADRQIARLTVVFHDTFRIGGGLLASFQKGSTVELDQARVEDGLWMTSSMAAHLDARIALFKSIRQDVRAKDTDFHKFDVGMLQQIGAPHPPPP